MYKFCRWKYFLDRDNLQVLSKHLKIVLVYKILKLWLCTTIHRRYQFRFWEYSEGNGLFIISHLIGLIKIPYFGMRAFTNCNCFKTVELFLENYNILLHSDKLAVVKVIKISQTFAAINETLYDFLPYTSETYSRGSQYSCRFAVSCTGFGIQNQVSLYWIRTDTSSSFSSKDLSQAAEFLLCSLLSESPTSAYKSFSNHTNNLSSFHLEAPFPPSLLHF